MPKENAGAQISLLLLKLLEEKDMYGYEMITALANRSEQVFQLKAGTLYPILYNMEKENWVQTYEALADGRIRKYYQLTKAGKSQLQEQTAKWKKYVHAVQTILEGEDRHETKEGCTF